MTFNVYACWFGAERFRRMAHALRVSLRRHCPDANILIEETEAPRVVTTYTANSAKLAHWVRVTDGLPDGARLLLIDGDCLVRAPIDDAWAHEFDIAITRKPDVKRLPVNAGVVFLRGSERVRAFMRQWLRINDRMLADRSFHLPYEGKYGGINQAALGYLREGPTDLHLIELPAEKYNACHAPLWSRWQDASIVHYKSHLRRALFQGPVSSGLRPLVNLHKEYQEC